MKKLIIVCEEKLRKYADLLAQLISSSDDVGDNVVGVKDGAVVAQVWTETDYIRQSVQMSSEQYILFIGNSKLMREKRYYMVEMFSEYFMHYRWLGKQASLYVDGVVPTDQYNEFIEFARSHQTNVEKIIDVKADIEISDEFMNQPKESGIKKLKVPAKIVQTKMVNTSSHGINSVKRLTNIKKITEQEYSCLIWAFYNNGLIEFLGLSEE